MAPNRAGNARQEPAAQRVMIAAVPVLFAFWGVFAPARAEVVKRSSVLVTMPRLAMLQISGDVSGLLTLMPDGSGESAYETGSVESAGDATVLTLNVTEAWDLTARLTGAWNCPGTYDKDENELKLRISNSPTGTIRNGAGSYLSLTTSDLSILSDDGACSDNHVNLQTKVLLDWTRDIPGAYSITVTYTLVGHLP
jgi:hypothetical protein